ncbi:MAG: heavy metal translocating P-type ATPase, partial [Armatimonadetes bacterium]|nr:heavy metal translocating P-type ATPase [Armatimonadota bacterium]
MRHRRLLAAFTATCVVIAAVFGVAGLPLVANILDAAAMTPVILVLTIEALAGIRRGAPGVDVIALIALAGSAALGSWLAGGVIAVMVAGGSALEESATARARLELSKLHARTPDVAHLQRNGQLEDVPATAVAVGDMLFVRGGEVVPVDGSVAAETALLDESSLTGEPLPVAHVVGSSIRSGVSNSGGSFSMVATATAQDSTWMGMIRRVEDAAMERPPLVRMADRWAVLFLPAVLVVTAAAWWHSGDPQRALAVLVVATPCPLILAAPVAFVCGVSRAAGRGVVVKGGSVLERLAGVHIALFDKTGTLTRGEPLVSSIVAAEPWTETDVLRLAASAEQSVEHVSARAVVRAAVAAGLNLSLPTSVQAKGGLGVSATVEGHELLVGAMQLLLASGVDTSGIHSRRLAAKAGPGSVWVAVDRNLSGVVRLDDALRPEAPRTLRQLRTLGLNRIVMLTGDSLENAEAVASRVHLDRILTGLLPQDKIDAVREEQRAGPVMMVGDGMNDALALGEADVGVAMGVHGSGVSATAADAVLLVDRLDRIPELIGIARRSRFIALQSIIVGMLLSFIAMGFAAGGRLPPIPGAFLQEAIDAAVILNALRVLVRPKDIPADT